eukprot:scaffold7377_cov389-Prasinococcus_capsulatus_cf.AAC.19
MARTPPAQGRSLQRRAHSTWDYHRRRSQTHQTCHCLQGTSSHHKRNRLDNSHRPANLQRANLLKTLLARRTRAYCHNVHLVGAVADERHQRPHSNRWRLSRPLVCSTEAVVVPLSFCACTINTGALATPSLVLGHPYCHRVYPGRGGRAPLVRQLPHRHLFGPAACFAGSNPRGGRDPRAVFPARRPFAASRTCSWLCAPSLASHTADRRASTAWSDPLVQCRGYSWQRGGAACRPPRISRAASAPITARLAGAGQAPPRFIIYRASSRGGGSQLAVQANELAADSRLGAQRLACERVGSNAPSAN